MTLSRDEAVVLVMIGSFAVWGVLHVLLVIRLARGTSSWRSLVALVVPPLAPYWAARSGLGGWALAWSCAALTWIVVRFFFAG